MNILVDGRALVRNSAGVSYFLKNALEEWAKQCPQNTFYIYTPGNMAETLNDGRLDFNNVRFLKPRHQFTMRVPNIIYLQMDIPYFCKKYAIEIYYAPVPHIPYGIPKNVKTIVTIHDVVNIEMASTMSWTNRLATKLFFNKAVNSADLIWANSDYTRQMVEKYYPHRRSQDVFVGGAADTKYYHKLELNAHEIEEIKSKYGIKDKFILFVGSLEPRKNLPFLLNLMPQLYRDRGVQLVVVGANKWKSSSIFNIINSASYPKESTIFTKYISDTELAQLYNIADLFVSTSFTEGLGLPQIEALMCGCPIVTSHNSAMIEVTQGKDGATTVPGYDVSVWTSVISAMLDNTPNVNVSQMQQYCWSNVISNLKQRTALI